MYPPYFTCFENENECIQLFTPIPCLSLQLENTAQNFAVEKDNHRKQDFKKRSFPLAEKNAESTGNKSNSEYGP